MRLKSKTTATLLIAIFMISVLALPYAFAFDYLQTGPTGGEAYFTTNDAYSGLGSVFLSDDGVGYTDNEHYGAGRIAIPVNILLADINSLSYWFSYSCPETHPYYFPYMILQIDIDGNLVTPDYQWLVMESPISVYQPAENTWVKFDADYDLWHTDGYTLMDKLDVLKGEYTDAKVIAVKVAVGEWSSGSYAPITAYVDDIEINGKIYDLETSGVSMTVIVEQYVPDIVSISVDPTSVDFSPVVQFGSSAIKSVAITNEGNVDVDVTNSIVEDGTFYEDYLHVTGGPFTSIAPLAKVDADLQLLDVLVHGEYTGTLVFWAEESTP